MHSPIAPRFPDMLLRSSAEEKSLSALCLILSSLGFLSVNLFVSFVFFKCPIALSNAFQCLFFGLEKYFIKSSHRGFKVSFYCFFILFPLIWHSVMLSQSFFVPKSEPSRYSYLEVFYLSLRGCLNKKFIKKVRIFFRENSLKRHFFLSNSLKRRLANDIFSRILFMKITISNFSTSTSSPWIFSHINDKITKLQKHIYFEWLIV